MNKINKGIVFSDDIKRILNGVNAFDYQYRYIPGNSVIKRVRDDFRSDVNKIFDNNVTIISEDEMLEINNLIEWSYPHCNIR